MQGLNLRFVQRPRHCDAVGGLLPRIHWVHEGRGVYRQLHAGLCFDGAPTAADVSVDRHQSPSLLCIRLKQSKTDPFRVGVSLFLGRTGRDLCPVTAVLAYLAIHPTSQGPLFVFWDGSYLTRDKLVALLRAGLRLMGIDPSRFSGHSFRIGAATTAAQVGIQDVTIKMYGRLESSAFQCYVRTPREQLAGISVQLAQK